MTEKIRKKSELQPPAKKNSEPVLEKLEEINQAKISAGQIFDKYKTGDERTSEILSKIRLFRTDFNQNLVSLLPTI